MLKISNKNSGCSYENIYPCKKVSRRKDILCDRYTKDKNCYVQSHFGTPEICLFYTGHKKCLFISIFVHIYTWNFCLNFFDILKFVFLGSGCRCTYEPKWISPVLVFCGREREILSHLAGDELMSSFPVNRGQGWQPTTHHQPWDLYRKTCVERLFSSLCFPISSCLRLSLVLLVSSHLVSTSPYTTTDRDRGQPNHLPPPGTEPRWRRCRWE